MDEKINKPKGNMDRATNGIEGIVDDANDETAGNMDEANTVNEVNYAQDHRTNQELQENYADDETNGNTGEASKRTPKSGQPSLRRKYEDSLDTRNKNKRY